MIIIYSTPTCSRCKLLAAAFQAAGIPFEEKSLDASVMARVLCETDIWVQAAPLVLDGYVWHFADDLFDASGNLKANWLVELKGVRPHKEFGGIGGQPDTKAQSSSKIWGSL
ncbi:hypothetical protein M0R72_08695 [Candidatus Pacearchaeota archaeon]|jgi:hypothetical protein|nr:hypothetical protein [Candidatus Pacearchaeota archaeon]